MTADGFLQQRQRHPVALAAAIAINVMAVTTLMLAKTGAIAPPPDIFQVIPIHEPPAPPPHPEPPRPREHHESARPTWAPDPAKSTTLLGPADVSKASPMDGESSGPGHPAIEPGSAEPAQLPEPLMIWPQPDTRFADDFQPPYPPQLLRTGIEGTVIVRVLIGTGGRVKQVEMIAADDPAFAAATERQALRRWRFRPATRDGEPVESWKRMTVQFEIRA